MSWNIEDKGGFLYFLEKFLVLGEWRLVFFLLNDFILKIKVFECYVLIFEFDNCFRVIFSF